MTMMSSLKAFLFASPAHGAMIGTAAVPSAGGEGGDFAALLGGIAQTPAAAGPGGALPMPNPVLPVPAEGEARALPLDAKASPPVDPLALPPGAGLPVEAPDLSTPMVAPAPVPRIADTEAPILMGRPEVAIAETEGETTPVEADEDADQPKPDAGEAMPIVPAATTAQPALPIVLPPGSAIPAMPEPLEAKLVTTAVAGKSDQSLPPASLPPAVEGSRPPASPERSLPSSDAPQAEAAPQDYVPAAPAARPARGNATGPVLSGEAIAVGRPAMKASVKVPQSAPAALPVMQQVPTTTAVPVASPMVAPIMVSTTIGTPAKEPALSVLSDVPAIDRPVDVTTQPIAMPVQNASATVKSEALSLLQLVREHFVRREGGASTERASPVAAPRTADPVVADSAPAASLVTLAPAPAIASAPAVAIGPIQAMPAAVDLGGTIAGQIVDMGVQGQWIDGLAKDIASLSSIGAQGRFQIRSDHLGAVQVDIRPGATGASVSLTVASDAAQQALQADGDRLIADAALVAMKITDLRVERGTISEAQRSDSAGQQQSGSNSQSQNQTQNGSQAMGQGQGQGLSQGMGQNRSGHRDNFSGNHKTGPDSAVLPQADSREGEATGARRAASRARYA
ncbi:hypothetical protein [Sphingobium aromaticiconvertens]|uniref:hypothetical protein n=1 Tax=Sphingobium aromaticiconvertens TaxID=365341 RepID=UPI00301AA124